MIIIGEMPSVEFVSDEEENKHIADSGCQYLLVVHNPRSSSLTLLPTPAPLHSSAHAVKVLRSVPASLTPAQLAYHEARNALGESFGSKKLQAAIRVQERNKGTIDVDAVGLPTLRMFQLLWLELSKEVTNMSRRIPPYNATMSDPAEVYDLHDIIPETNRRRYPRRY
ncbi:hypothetical protein ARMGADRAFT_1096365 [Armillaria gallica]|uniref:Uncharacterized protein n=1 Tax=Armillaria gallica TaxID=47427 RepID=A0A2H3ELX9_ARMGA|nr:hypothetical protein ARMGADRAFT_1096365 [Armillaria gallica]